MLRVEEPWFLMVVVVVIGNIILNLLRLMCDVLSCHQIKEVLLLRNNLIQ